MSAGARWEWLNAANDLNTAAIEFAAILRRRLDGNASEGDFLRAQWNLRRAAEEYVKSQPMEIA